jgi:hypothetical protein
MAILAMPEHGQDARGTVVEAAFKRGPQSAFGLWANGRREQSGSFAAALQKRLGRK